MLRRSNSNKINHHLMRIEDMSFNQAYTAANLAFNRAQEQEGNIGKNHFQVTDSVEIDHNKNQYFSTINTIPTLKQQSSVRFTGPHAVYPRKSTRSKRLSLVKRESAFGSEDTTLNGSSCTRDRSQGIQSSNGKIPYLKTITKNFTDTDPYEEYCTNEQDLPSTPSSYRRIQKSESMFNPLGTTGVFYSKNIPENPQTQSPASLKSRLSYSQLPRVTLRVSRSADFLRSRWHRSESHESALRQARDRFLHDARQQHLRDKSSFLSRSRSQRLERKLRNSFRSFSTDSDYPERFSCHTQELKSKDSSLRGFACKASKSVRNRLKKTFGWSSKENSSEIPTQQIDAKETHVQTHYGDIYQDHNTVSLATCSDKGSISHVASFTPSIYRPDLNNSQRSQQGSIRSVKINSVSEESRVTSWTSTAVNTISSKDDLKNQSEKDQHSIVVKKDRIQIPSSSVTFSQSKTVKNADISHPIKNLQRNLPQDKNSDLVAVSSARVYSALMRRLEAKDPQFTVEPSEKLSNEPYLSSTLSSKTSPSCFGSQSTIDFPTIKYVSSGDTISEDIGSTKYNEKHLNFCKSDSKTTTNDSNNSKNYYHKVDDTVVHCASDTENIHDKISLENNLTHADYNSPVKSSQLCRASTKFENKSYGERLLDSSHNQLNDFEMTTQGVACQKLSPHCNQKISLEDKSTFFSGGTVVFSRLASPFRRAMEQGAFRPQTVSPSHSHWSDMRTSETTYSESIYSRSASGETPKFNNSTHSLVLENGGKMRKRSPTILTGGDAVIIGQETYTPTIPQRNHHQYVACNNSNEWKTWMSSEVAKLNYGKENIPTITSAEITPLLSKKLRSTHSSHLRENAQISNEDFPALHRKSSEYLSQSFSIQEQNLNIGNASSELISGKKSINHQKESRKDQSESTVSSSLTSTIPPPSTPAFPLRTIQSKNSLKSITPINASGSSIKVSNNNVRHPLYTRITSSTSLFNIKANSNTINIENLVLTPQKNGKIVRSPTSINRRSPDKFGTGSNTERKSTLSQTRYRTHGPEIKETNLINTESHHNFYKPDWWLGEATVSTDSGGKFDQDDVNKKMTTIGSKEMVEMFLNSRRKRIVSLSGGGDGDDGSVFL